jgi:hypothetical protein
LTIRPTLHKVLRIVLALLILLAVAIGLTSLNHPIILKWVTGSARHHGQPIPATVYTNGQVNERVKLFYTDEENNYLVSLDEGASSGTLRFMNIDLNKKSIGQPIATSKLDYDLIAGHMFQSKTAEQFVPFLDEAKESSFDPQLTFTEKQIRFNMPSGELKSDSIRIILP